MDSATKDPSTKNPFLKRLNKLEKKNKALSKELEETKLQLKVTGATLEDFRKQSAENFKGLYLDLGKDNANERLEKIETLLGKMGHPEFK